jgi:hypothetical protein
MKIKLTDLPKKYQKPNKNLAGIPDGIKDPKAFAKMEKKLALLLITSHKHRSPASYVKCEECQAKRTERLEAIKSYGFKDFAQYMLYKRVMSMIINKSSIQVA